MTTSGNRLIEQEVKWLVDFAANCRHCIAHTTEAITAEDCTKCAENRVPDLNRLLNKCGVRMPGDKPKIVCLCGSTRFTDLMLVKQWELTKQGCVVLSWCALPDWYFQGEEKAHIGDQEGVKALVDEVHKRKIDLSDSVFVINKNGYIGQSTRSEIDYAIAHGKPVEYLEPLPESEEAMICNLCGKPSVDGKEHAECMAREQFEADRPYLDMKSLPEAKEE